MESILMIVLFALFAVLSDKMGGKKKVPPRPRRNIDIQLPSPVPRPLPGQHRDAPVPVKRPQPVIADSPVFPEPAQVHVPQPRPVAAVQPVSLQPVQQPEKLSRSILPPLTVGTVQQAVVMAEILGRPKAWRQFHRH